MQEQRMQVLTRWLNSLTHGYGPSHYCVIAKKQQMTTDFCKMYAKQH